MMNKKSGSKLFNSIAVEATNAGLAIGEARLNSKATALGKELRKKTSTYFNQFHVTAQKNQLECVVAATNPKATNAYINLIEGVSRAPSLSATRQGVNKQQDLVAYALAEWCKLYMAASQRWAVFRWNRLDDRVEPLEASGESLNKYSEGLGFGADNDIFGLWKFEQIEILNVAEDDDRRRSAETIKSRLWAESALGFDTLLNPCDTRIVRFKLTHHSTVYFLLFQQDAADGGAVLDYQLLHRYLQGLIFSIDGCMTEQLLKVQKYLPSNTIHELLKIIESENTGRPGDSQGQFAKPKSTAGKRLKLHGLENRRSMLESLLHMHIQNTRIGGEPKCIVSVHTYNRCAKPSMRGTCYLENIHVHPKGAKAKYTNVEESLDSKGNVAANCSVAALAASHGTSVLIRDLEKAKHWREAYMSRSDLKVDSDQQEWKARTHIAALIGKTQHDKLHRQYSIVPPEVESLISPNWNKKEKYDQDDYVATIEYNGISNDSDVTLRSVERILLTEKCLRLLKRIIDQSGDAASPSNAHIKLSEFWKDLRDMFDPEWGDPTTSEKLMHRYCQLIREIIGCDIVYFLRKDEFAGDLHFHHHGYNINLNDKKTKEAVKEGLKKILGNESDTYTVDKEQYIEELLLHRLTPRPRGRTYELFKSQGSQPYVFSIANSDENEDDHSKEMKKYDKLQHCFKDMVGTVFGSDNAMSPYGVLWARWVEIDGDTSEARRTKLSKIHSLMMKSYLRITGEAVANIYQLLRRHELAEVIHWHDDALRPRWH